MRSCSHDDVHLGHHARAGRAVVPTRRGACNEAVPHLPRAVQPSVSRIEQANPAVVSRAFGHGAAGGGTEVEGSFRRAGRSWASQPSGEAKNGEVSQ